MRFCELCETKTGKRECPDCGADTVKVPKAAEAGIREVDRIARGK